MPLELCYAILALTYAVYLTYHLILTRYKPRSYERAARKIFAATLYFIILIFVLNISGLSSIIGETPAIFSPYLAEKKIQLYIATNTEILRHITEISLFIAIYDIIVSILALLPSAASLMFVAAYKPYTHALLATLEGSSRLLSRILLLAYIIKGLLKIGIILRDSLSTLSSLIIPKETRALGKAALMSYIILLIVLPYTVNISLKNNVDYIENYIVLKKISIPRSIDMVAVDLRDWRGAPLEAPGILLLENNDTYIAATVQNAKHIALPSGVYRGIGVCIYWHNFSNNACCFKKSYRECYGCYLTPYINTTMHNIRVQIPYTIIPCNNSGGVSGLFREEEGPLPIYQPGKIVFTLTPTAPSLRIKVIGGRFSIAYNNATGWIVNYKITEGAGEYIPQCKQDLLQKYSMATKDWIERSNPSIYGQPLTPSIGKGELYSEYTLEVYLTRTENKTSTCPKTVEANITIYGSGCWSPRLAYISKWNLMGAIAEYSASLENYLYSTYDVIVNLYVTFILWSVVVAIFFSMVSVYPLLNIIKYNILSLVSLNIFHIKPRKFDKEENKKKRQEQSISDLILYKHEKSIIKNLKKVGENINYNFKIMKEKHHIEKILKNPSIVEKHGDDYYTTTLLYSLAYNYGILEKLPTPARRIIVGYPFYLRRNSNLMLNIRMRKEIDKAIIYYAGALKYNVHILDAIKKIVEIRETILNYIENYYNNGEKINEKTYEDIYDDLILSREIPDLDYMILTLALRLHNTNDKNALYKIISPKMLNILIEKIISRYKMYNYIYDKDIVDKIRKMGRL